MGRWQGEWLDFFCWPMVFSPCFPHVFPHVFSHLEELFFFPMLKSPEAVFCSTVPGSNVCPDQYRAIESVEDCQEAAGAGMQGLPPPSSWEKNDPNNQGHCWVNGVFENGGAGWDFFFVLGISFVKKHETGSLFEMDLDSLVYVVISSATSIISCEKWVLTWFQPLIFFQPTRGIFGFQTPGSPSSCFKDLETGKVRFNSISMRGFEKLDEWQKLDHRKICKKAFSHLDFLNLFFGEKA